MKIKYVISTMVFWWREHHLSFEQECDFLNSLGFGVEIWPTIRGHTECRYAPRNWPRLKEATKGMTVSLHSRDDGPTLDDWKEQLQCAKMLDANIVANLESLCISDQFDIADWDFVSEVVNLAKDYEVKLCVETGSLPILKEVGKRFPSIWYCFDTGFANIDTKFTFKDYVDKLAPRIAHIHLTDNYGDLDDHEPPGLQGGISRENWDYLLKALMKHKNEVIGSFEMFPCMPGVMIRQAHQFLFDTLNWPGRPAKQPNHEASYYRPY